jgi:hypothetical protein
MSKERLKIKQLMFESGERMPKANKKGYYFMSNQVEWLMEQYVLTIKNKVT